MKYKKSVSGVYSKHALAVLINHSIAKNVVEKMKLFLMDYVFAKVITLDSI
jgi:hypothetical protein